MSVLERVYLKRNCAKGVCQGFTVVELLLSTIVISFIALVSLSTLQGVVSSRENIEEYVAISDEIRYLSNLLKQDLNNATREVRKQDRKFIALGEADTMKSDITFYCSSYDQARENGIESDFYEVQYKLSADQEGELLFTRRKWPTPKSGKHQDNENKGVMMSLSKNVVKFEVKCLNKKKEWLNEWGKRRKAFPEMIEVNLALMNKETERVCKHSFLVTIPRLPTVQYFKK